MASSTNTATETSTTTSTSADAAATTSCSKSGRSSTTATTTTTTMRALEFVLSTGEIKVVQVPKPTLIRLPKKKKSNLLLVKVVAAAIDHGLAMEFPKAQAIDAYFVHSRASPLYLGWHYSGIVEEIDDGDGDDEDADDDSHNITVGTAVFGFLEYSPSTRQGTFAEYILVNRHQCAVKPESVSFEVAAASTTESITALQALRDLGQLTTDSESGCRSSSTSSTSTSCSIHKSVLICGASGGVGSAAVCIAKLLGAGANVKVTAMCSDREVQRVQDSFHPDAIINRTAFGGVTGDPITSSGETYDIIFDCPSAFSAYKYFHCLKPKGRFIVTTPSFGFLWGWFYSILTCSSKRVRMVMCQPNRKDLTLVGQWLAQGSLNIAIDSTFHVADMHAAIQRQGNKNKQGRVVIQVQDGWEPQQQQQVEPDTTEPKKNK